MAIPSIAEHTLRQADALERWARRAREEIWYPVTMFNDDMTGVFGPRMAVVVPADPALGRYEVYAPVLEVGDPEPGSEDSRHGREELLEPGKDGIAAADRLGDEVHYICDRHLGSPTRIGAEAVAERIVDMWRTGRDAVRALRAGAMTTETELSSHGYGEDIEDSWGRLVSLCCGGGFELVSCGRFTVAKLNGDMYPGLISPREERIIGYVSSVDRDERGAVVLRGLRALEVADAIENMVPRHIEEHIQSWKNAAGRVVGLY